MDNVIQQKEAHYRFGTLNFVSEMKDDEGLIFGLRQSTLFPAALQAALPFVLECAVSGGGITW
jgi:hypothetical protein